MHKALGSVSRTKEIGHFSFLGMYTPCLLCLKSAAELQIDHAIPHALGGTFCCLVPKSLMERMPPVYHPSCYPPPSSPGRCFRNIHHEIKAFPPLPSAQWPYAESCQTQMAFSTLRAVFWYCHLLMSFGSMSGPKLEPPKAHPCLGQHFSPLVVREQLRNCLFSDISLD